MLTANRNNMECHWQVVGAKERLDAKIEEKRIADLEAEIDAHVPSKRSTKLITSSSYTEQGNIIV